MQLNFDIFIKKPVLATVVSLLIFLFGLRGLMELEVRQFPKMSHGVIHISTTFAGADAQLVQSFVTSPIEKAIASADGVDYITSNSSDSFSNITAFIRMNYDPNIAMTDIMSKVSQVRNALPKGSDQPVIQKSTGDDAALMYIGYTSTKMSNEEITDYLSRVVQPKLQTVAGVANAEVFGNRVYSMRIWLNADKLTAYHLSAADVVAALQRENVQAPAGDITSTFVTYQVSAKTGRETEAEFAAITIKSVNGALIRLKDVAKVELGAAKNESSIKFNGRTGVFIGIQPIPTANPLTIANSISRLLPQLQAYYPPTLESKVVYDSSKYIRASIHEVIRSIVEATLIVVAVIFIFIGALRAVIIPIVTIPLSLVGVCALMVMMGYSLNLLTLLAMVIAIGLVVDDAIVVVENIYRHIENGLTPYEAALKGVREITTPIISMTTTLAAVYAPIGFMSGLTGALFKEFAFTLALAVIISGIIALTLSPMMCSKLLSQAMLNNRFVHFIDQCFEKIKRFYQAKLTSSLKQRKMMLTLIGFILIGCIAIAATTPTQLAPDEDQSFIFFSLTGPDNTNIAYTEKYTGQLDAIFNAIPEREDYFIINGNGSENSAIAGLILKPWDQRKRSQNEVLASIQAKLSSIIGMQAVAFPLPSLPGNHGGMPVKFIIESTDDFLTINHITQQLIAAAKQSGLFTYVDTNLKFSKPSLEVNIDANKAASLGVSMDSIGNTLSAFLGGNTVSRFNLAGQSYDVIVQLKEKNRLSPEDINRYQVTNQEGKLIPLANLITTKMVTKTDALHHFQQLNSASLSAMLMPGVTLNQGLAFLQTAAQRIFPSGFSFDYGGQSRQAMQESNTMLYTFLFALFIIYLVLSAQFESFRDPLIILISVPLSVFGAFIPLHIGLATLNIYTGIGLITLIGLISKHGILMVDFANKLQIEAGLNRFDAIVKAASLRLRPILMTTVAMVFGVIPLILANGAGATSRFDIGIVIAAGMTVGTLFTLFVVPTMYALFGRRLQLNSHEN